MASTPSTVASALSGGARTSLVHAVVALSQLVVVLVLKAVHAAAAIKLATKHLVRLDETLQLAGQVCVLALQALRMLFQRIPLSEEVTVVSPALTRSDAEAFDFASDNEEVVFALLEASLSVSDLN